MVEIDMTRIPRHIAIIMDGNGRWANERGQDRSFGHAAGIQTVKDITAECTRIGVKYLTLYTFSTENWNRPENEVGAIMDLLIAELEEELFMNNNVRFRVIGDMDRLPERVQVKLKELTEHTKNNDRMTVVAAISYSSKWELDRAVKNIASDAIANKISVEDINEELISSYLTTNFMPDPDLLIRTGGELRLSNYLLWQIAYSELYFCDTYWPDFNKEELYKAIKAYQGRQRRFGKTEKQIENETKE